MSEWGKGVTNNTIEWGRGSTNNTNGWGSVYGVSESGDTQLEVANLLDQFSGAAAAYSVRKLSSTYSGSALRVRRSSDNTEQDIGFDGNDLDTSALTTFVGANDGFVVTWYDQSGNSNDATNSSASTQPQIVVGGTINTVNGKTTIDFDTTEFLDMSSYIWTGTVAKSAFVTGNANGTGVNQGMIAVGNQSALGGAINITSEIAVRVGGATVFNDDFVDSALNILSINIPANSTTDDISAWLNSSALSQNSSSGQSLNTEASTIKRVGSVYNGNLSELVCYDLNQSANRTAIESNINAYYSIY